MHRAATDAETGIGELVKAFASLPALIALNRELLDKVNYLTKEVAALKGQPQESTGEVLNIKQAARLLNMCEESVRRLARRGLIKRSLGLRKILIPREEIDNYLNSTLSNQRD